VACVAEVLERLIAEEGVAQEDIVILSSHALGGSSFAGRRVGPYSITPYEEGRRGVRFASIRSFKGLESPIVVLTELGDLPDAAREQQIYVGLSRARNHCLIVAPALP
jgi:hypothetical protein